MPVVSSSDYAANLKILTKSAQLQPYRPNRAQRHYRQHRTKRNLLLKARQLGFSTEIQASNFIAAVSSTSLQATLAHDDDTTQKLRRMAKRFYDGLTDDLRPPRGLDNATTTTYPATGSEVTIATAGNLNTGRGGTYTRFHGSEVAFWKDAGSIMAGVMQGIPTDGEVDLESTANGAQGWFFEQCMEALDGNSKFSLHFYEWWWDEGYQLPLDEGEVLVYTDEEARLVAKHGLAPEQIKWRRDKQKELGRLFLQEYPEDPRTCFLLSGEGYFGDLTGVFTAPFGATPEQGHRYVGGLDFGQANDYTVLSIGDATALQQVELLRLNRLPWAEMRRQINERCRYWGVSLVEAELNSIGQPNIEALQADGLKMELFLTTNASKAGIIAGLHAGVHEQGWKLQNIPEQRRELNAFQSRQTPSGLWAFSAPDGEHDDIVMADALMLHGVYGGSRVTMGPAPQALKDFFGGFGGD